MHGATTVQADKVDVDTVRAASHAEEDVLNLAAEVMSLLVDIKSDVPVGVLLRVIAFLAIWHPAVQIQVHAIIPREAEAHSV